MKLPVPTLDHKHVYVLSRERFIDEDYKRRLEKGQSDVLALGDDYVARAQGGLLHELPENAAVPDHILAGDMQTLYKSGFLRRNSDARRLYERLRVSSPSRVCPFCLHRVVKTLDHYLPKKKFGAYSVLPQNLVPCCRDCNSEKDEEAARDRASSIIHPYFDDIDGDEWLWCELVMEDGFCTPTFYIRSANVNVSLLPRLISHMTKLDLFDLYDVEGAREINDMCDTLIDSFDASGAEGVRKLCSSMARSRGRLAQNYWRAVLWKVAAGNDAFTDMQWT